ncbi:MAG: ATP-binding protein [Deltaproteobacteria bacterium]|nr:ATP-binding protein [Deltaproteobacteria bacterium]MCL5277474.1 ATP-binding protein [Deltaproteobacteria bacterium]
MLYSKAKGKHTYADLLLKWSIRSRYVVYPVVVVLLLLYFRQRTGIYPYFIAVSAVPFGLNIVLDFVYGNIGNIRYSIGLFIALLDSLSVAFVVLITGGYHTPFFSLFLLQFLSVGLLSSMWLDAVFFLINSGLYLLASYLGALVAADRLLRSGTIADAVKFATRYQSVYRSFPTESVIIHISIFTMIAGILMYINGRLNRLSRRLSSNKGKLDFLLNVSDKLGKLVSVEGFLKEVTHTVRHSLGYKYNALLLLNGEKTELYVRTYSPNHGSEFVNDMLGFRMDKLRIPMSSESNLLVKAVKEQAPLSSHDERDVLVDAVPAVSEALAADIQRATGTKTFIGVPIVTFGEVIGALEVESDVGDVQREELDLLRSFASQVGTGIVNNRLYAETLNQKKEIEVHYAEMNNVLSELQVSYAKLEEFTAELDRSKKKLEEMKGILYHSDKLASIGQLIASITHQFSTPITAIMGQTDLLIKELDENGIGTGRERIEKIRLGVDKLNESARKLMQSVRQTELEFKSVNINDIVNSTVGLWEYELRSMDVKLDVQLSDTLPVVEGIPDALEQLLVNLVSNAKDAMENRRGTITISTRLFDRDNIEIEVRDEGTGIPDDQLDKIFTPFFTTKPAGKGTGLGMVIVMNAVEAHDGRFMVRSKLDKGTAFTIILPIKHHGRKRYAV